MSCSPSTLPASDLSATPGHPGFLSGDRNAELVRAVFECGPSAMLLLTVEGHIVEANARARELLQHSDVAGVHLEDFVHVEDRGQIVDALTSSAQPERRDRLELRMLRTDGSTVPVGFSVVPTEKVGGRPCFVMTLRDLSAVQAREVEVRHTQKLEAVGRLAAGIAHEINTPIQYIGDNVRFLGQAITALLEAARVVDETLSDEPALHAQIQSRLAELDVEFFVEEAPIAVNQTLEGIDKVAKIVRAMKSFGRFAPEAQAAADLEEALDSALTVGDHSLKKVADIVRDYGGIPQVVCRAGDLNQVLLNLLLNAADAIAEKVGDTDERGTITVRTRAEGDIAIIEVEDTGAGMPEHVQALVFDPFYTTKPVGKGTGQGLSLARSVIDQHEGKISFSTQPGAGTCFRIELPVSGAVSDGEKTA